MNKKITVPLVIVLLALAIVLLLFRPSRYARGELDSFAKCLSEKGAVMYGANWCPHCQNEKKRFGSSFKFIPYVECPDEPQKCLAAGIEGYPTWIFSASPAMSADRQADGPDGKKFEGEQGLEKLSEISNCPLPDNKK